MRAPILSLAVVAAALLGATQMASAQTASSYPWCAADPVDGAQSPHCYYTSREQCRATMAGIGGVCVPNAEYRGAQESRPTAPSKRR